MPTHQPDRTVSPGALDSLEEFRVLARVKEAKRRAGESDPGPRLPNGARMARLHAIADNPYIKGAFGHMSTVEMMRMCAEQLAASQQYRPAGHLLNQIAHHENVRAAMAAAARPEPEGEPEFHLEPEPRLLLEYTPSDRRQLELSIPDPVDPPPPHRSAWDVFVAGLTDRELAHFLRIQQQEEANPPRGPRLQERLMPYLEKRGLHDP